ncbi:MAG: aldo/keto reductase [Chloroflexota bacterium]|nr:aldo/keto reductase [Chloroflexota bacterium]MDE2908327.1 aldo/keto reductase [Chloroflexota bacterium]
MEYRVLGRSGVKLAPLGLGTGNFADPTPEDESIDMLKRAVAAGINLIDTANSYTNGESERFIGRAFAKGLPRDEVILATKAFQRVGPGPNDEDLSRLHLIRACEDSLRRLKTDTIDLYQVHRPSPTIPVDETLGALTDLVQQGKVRYIGCSTHPAWKVMEAIMVSELKGYARFISEQPPYNLLDRRIENELVPMCEAYGLGLITWSPLAQGVLAGRYASATDLPPDSRGALRGGIYAERINQAGIEVGNQIVKLAAEYGISPAQLATLWVKDQPGITAPLIGPRTLEQLEHLLPVLEMTLSDELRAACDRLVPPGGAVASFFNTAEWMKQRLI